MASIAKNFGYNILLNVSRVIFPLITAPYVSRVLEPSGIGLFGFSNTYVSYFVLFALLGIPLYGVREISKCKDSLIELNKLTSELFSISFLSTLIVSLIYLGTLFFIPQLRENLTIFLIAGTVLYLAPFQIDWFFQGIEKFDFITIRSIIVRIISIVCIFIFIKTKEDLPLYVGIAACGTIVGNIWNYIALRSKGVKITMSIKGMKKHVRPILILFSSSLAISIYNVLDTVMLGFMSAYSEVGYYSNASYISRTLLVLVTSLSAVAIPRISRFTNENKLEEINVLVRKSFSIISLLAIPITVGIICLSKDFTLLFFGDKFSGAILPLSILSMLITIVGFNNLTGVQILIGMGRDKQFFWAVLSGAILNLMMNLFLIPLFGAVGASISSVVAETVILFITIIFIIRFTTIRIKGIGSDIVKSFVGCSFFIPICYYLHIVAQGWYFLVAAIVLCVLTYIIIEIILKHKSLSLIYSILKNKLR